MAWFVHGPGQKGSTVDYKKMPRASLVPVYLCSLYAATSQNQIIVNSRNQRFSSITVDCEKMINVIHFTFQWFLLLWLHGWYKKGFCADSESVNRRVHSNHTVIEPISEGFFLWNWICMALEDQYMKKQICANSYICSCFPQIKSCHKLFWLHEGLDSK